MSEFIDLDFNAVFNDVRQELNDSGGDDYTDAKLLTHAASAHSEIQEELSKHDIVSLETVSTAFSYTLNDDEIPIPGAVTDFWFPLEIWERRTATDYWQRMEGPVNLPPPDPQASSIQELGVWEWSEGKIKVPLIGISRLILIRYKRHLPYPADADTMDIDGFYWPLVYGTAFRAARRTGRDDLMRTLGAEYQVRLSNLTLIASRPMQGQAHSWRGGSGTGSVRRLSRHG